MKAGLFTKRYHPPGTAPGTLTAVEYKDIIRPRIHLVDYDATDFSETSDATIDDCRAFLETPRITWINVQGHADPDMMHALGEMLGLHTLALEDILNTGQRPKFEMYGEQVFIVASLPVLNENGVYFEQVSLFLGHNYVVSFYASETRFFEPALQLLRKNRERLRKRGADYLLYFLLDIIIDQGFPVLEHFGERLEQLEEVMLDRPDKTTLAELHLVKRELRMLRRLLWPQREMINVMLRDQPEIITDETGIYLRDCYDHTIQIIDLLETYRDIAADLLDIYISSTSRRLNENIRVLTVIATLFIPPTFVTGLYGMNFDRNVGPLNMPELGWPYGYLAVWIVIFLMIGGMLAYFKSKKMVLNRVISASPVKQQKMCRKFDLDQTGTDQTALF